VDAGLCVGAEVGAGLSVGEVGSCVGALVAGAFVGFWVGALVGFVGTGCPLRVARAGPVNFIDWVSHGHQ